MNQTGFYPAAFLLPAGADMTKWSIVACDQYTSEPEYWRTVEETVGNSPSTLRIIIPEIYLEETNVNDRIAHVNQAMEEYLSENVLRAWEGFVLVRRTLQNGAVRRGLMGLVDLERYEFVKGSQTLIRATEGTVLERIPPRVRVRENAALECPHIMLLIDDPEKTVIEPLEASEELEQLYRFPLMQESGSIEGFLCGGDEERRIFSALEKLADKDAYNDRYGLSGQSPLLFAVGDGNHSLATAKTCYENLKKALPPEEASYHPARYALVEVVNLHDESLIFEPIHRVVFDVDTNELEAALYAACTETPAPGAQKFILCRNGRETSLYWKKACSNLPVGTLQAFLDAYLAAHGGRIDYIHGDDVVRKLSAQPESMGFLLEVLPKTELFKTVALDGALPRKTFSMGHACDKRFYLESRRIR